MRQIKHFSLPENFSFERIFDLADKFNVSVVLNSNSSKQFSNDKYRKYKLIAGIDVVKECNSDGKAFNSIKKFYEETQDWIFGFLTYDVKNEIEDLNSGHPDNLGFPVFHFFQPRYVIIIDESGMQIQYLTKHDTEEAIVNLYENLILTKNEINPIQQKIKISQRTSIEEYLNTVNKIKEHISKGDIYELNYCVEFFSEKTQIDPLEVYMRLNSLSPMPFSCYFKLNDKYLVCASPERFLARRGSKIISQPIKGTAPRGKNSAEDLVIKKSLHEDVKEQSENVMIVDLVRNDLSRTASKGSVQVEELFGIYTFQKLHQMISTVVSEINPGIHFTETIRSAFPMGSMTGAPKIRAMQLIEEYENSRRGLYSGTVGYIDPSGDFDFNVVIRSILYNLTNGYLSFLVGSAITAGSNPEKEYQECLLKAEAMIEALEGKR